MESPNTEMKDTPLKYYLAGPMSGHLYWNFPAFDLAAAQLRWRGYQVWSPAENDRKMYGFDPLMRADAKPPPLDVAIREDIRNMTECHGVILLPGWERSEGVMRELLAARALDLPVYLYKEGPLVNLGQETVDKCIIDHLCHRILPASPNPSSPGVAYMDADPKTGAQKGQKRARFDLLPWSVIRRIRRQAQRESLSWPLIGIVDNLVWWWGLLSSPDMLVHVSPLENLAAQVLLFLQGRPRDSKTEAKVIWQLAEVYGANAKPLGKYEPRNWEKGMAWSVLFAAAMRHGMAAIQGEELDADDGLPHMCHFLWHCVALLFYAERGLGTDDRPVALPSKTSRGAEERQ